MVETKKADRHNFNIKNKFNNRLLVITDNYLQKYAGVIISNSKI